MIAFEVNDMTCGHCVSTITKALKSTDKDAKVTIDLAKHLVLVDSTQADAQELHDVIAEAGYNATQTDVRTVQPRVNDASCCGHCR
jgi:copper chaperone